MEFLCITFLNFVSIFNQIIRLSNVILRSLACMGLDVVDFFPRTKERKEPENDRYCQSVLKMQNWPSEFCRIVFMIVKM